MFLLIWTYAASARHQRHIPNLVDSTQWQEVAKAQWKIPHKDYGTFLVGHIHTYLSTNQTQIARAFILIDMDRPITITVDDAKQVSTPAFTGLHLRGSIWHIIPGFQTLRLLPIFHDQRLTSLTLYLDTARRTHHFRHPLSRITNM